MEVAEGFMMDVESAVRRGLVVGVCVGLMVKIAGLTILISSSLSASSLFGFNTETPTSEFFLLPALLGDTGSVIARFNLPAKLIILGDNKLARLGVWACRSSSDIKAVGLDMKKSRTSLTVSFISRSKCAFSLAT